MAEYDKRIIQADRVFKGFFTIAILLTLIGVGIGVNEVFTVGRRIDQSTNATQKSLRCIGEYFTQTDRAKLTIQDINSCTLVRQ